MVIAVFFLTFDLIVDTWRAKGTLAASEVSMLKVIRQRDFSLLWVAGLISMIGDWMIFVALPITVYELSGSAAATGGILIAGRVPSLFLGSVAGVFVDRWDRRRTMIIVNVIRAPIMLLLLAIDSADRLWIAYIVAFGVSAMSQFFGPAENALLPQLVAADALISANALNALNNNLARLIGPAIGGVIAARYGLSGVAVIDSMSFFLAAGLIAAIAMPSSSSQVPEAADGAGLSVWREWKSGLLVIRASRVLMVVFVVMALTSLGEGVMGAIFWVFVDEVLKGGSAEAGWLLSAQAIGGLVGSVVIGSWFKGSSAILLLAWGAIGLGVIDLAIFNYPAFFGGIWLGLVLMVIVGVPATAFGTGFTSTIQTEAEDAYRGRVFGALNTTMALSMIAGAAIAGAVTVRLGSVTVLSIQSASYIAAGAFVLWMLAPRTMSRIGEGENVAGNQGAGEA
ncbi:MAG TPA: MFS transporter [Thermomicrobiales bacterium]|nr:MFS transporter [Thermomicrobiales bacterium]